jgi:heme exporter protein D
MIQQALDFLRQGGYALYVWSAFGMTFLLLIMEVIQLRRSRRTILTRVGRLVRLRTPRPKSTTKTKAPAGPLGEPRGEQR